jgi:cytochrome c
MQLARLILIASSLVAGAADAQDAQDLLRKHDCYICHAERETRTGPAFADIAGKYRNNPHAAAALVAVVRKGAHGSGPWPMPPLPQVPSADATKMVAYILALKE